MQSHWRQARSADLPDITEIAARIHPGLAERDEVLAEKMRLFPDGCMTLVADDAIVGYGLSHPWKLRQIPGLDDFLGALPADADCLYLHDVAVLPEYRGRQTAGSYIATIATIAKSASLGSASLGFLALVSVYGTNSFWARFGFRAVTPDAALRAKLASYGETAKYMINDLRISRGAEA